jgi:Transposase IS66 family.
MDINSAPRSELVRLIYEMADKIALLEGEVARLKEQLAQKGEGKNSSSSPAFVKPNKKKKKATERKKREKAYTRKKESPTEKIFHTEEVCTDCSGVLGKPTVSYTRQVIDLPITPYIVTEHVVFKRWCYNCKKCIQPEVNLSDKVLGKGRIGINLAAAIVTMRDRLRLPIAVIQHYLRLFYHLRLSKGEIVQLLHTAAKIGRPTYENLLGDLRKSNVVHADETGGREDGRNGYFWSFSTENIHLLLYRPSRASKVVEEIVGTESEYFQGVLVSDFYAAYNTYQGFHQRCWVHLLRDMHELKEKHKKHPPLNKWAKQVKVIYEEAKAYTGPDPNSPPGLAVEERILKQKEFEEKLEKICSPYVTKNAVMSTLCARIMTFMPELFVFVRFPNVSADNNPAERIIRHTVVARKIQGGTRSQKGSETKSILTSLFDTWSLQGKNPLEQCRLLLATC